jgi:CRP-like cAMP-binding protein
MDGPYPPEPAAALAALPLLEGVDPDRVDSLSRLMRPVSVESGFVLGREGEAGEDFWFLLEGSVEITVAAPPGTRLLARAGPGSILGELALLRRGPRTATLTALESCRLLAGERKGLDALLGIDTVRARLRRLASGRLAADLKPVRTELRNGAPVLLRPLLPSDRGALDDALHHLSRQSVRRRFFSAATPSAQLIDYLMDIDYVDHFAWAVLDAATHEGMAVGRYVRPDPSEPAEIAFTTIDKYQGQGIATLLLGAIGVAAREARISSLTAVVMDDNMAMRTVFARAGGKAHFDEPGLLRFDVDPAAAAALLDPQLQARIAAAVHDVVTAASLALS